MSAPKPKSISVVSAAMMKKHLYHKFRDLNDQSGDEDVEGKVVVITGALDGIGRAVTQQLAKRGATIVMACLDVAKCQKVAQEIKRSARQAQLTVVKLDLCNFDSVRSCAEEIKDKYGHVNILINNSSFLSVRPLIGRTEAGHERHLAANHLGHFLLSLLLLQQLKNGAPSRVICIGSSAFQTATLNMDDLDMETNKSLGEMNLRGFSNSKLCNFLFARELGKRLQGTEVHTYGVCPGFTTPDLVWIDWTRIPGCVNRASARVFCATADQGAETVLYCAVSGQPEVADESGRMYHFRKPWREADNFLSDEQAEELWERSETMVGTSWLEVS